MSTNLDVSCVSEKDLTDEHAEEIMKLQQLAFPDGAVFKTQRWYHTPLADDHLWFALRQGGKLIGSTLAVHRRVTTSAGDFLIAGIGNVCADPAATDVRAGRLCMKAVHDYIAESDTVDFGLLFCRLHLRTYYRWQGWKVIENPIFATDAQGARRQTHGESDRFVMIYPGRRPVEDWPADGEVDLNGEDW